LWVKRGAGAPVIYHQVAIDQQSGNPKLNLRTTDIGGVKNLVNTRQRTQRNGK